MALIEGLLEIDTSFFQSSKIEHHVEKDPSGGYWGLNFFKTLGADIYINAPGGEALYTKEIYEVAGT